MHYIIYKTTNKINGKIYIGKHQTKDLNDRYMGSGKHFRHAIAKYGIENFTKEILFQFDSEDEMNSKEAELVTEEFCLREDTYNICVGGKGGFGYINSTGLNLRTGMLHSKKVKEKISVSRTGKMHSNSSKLKMSENNWAKIDKEAHKSHISKIHKGIPKTQEHKDKISNSLKSIKQETVICPYCNINGLKPIMNRWHFDNCKLRV